MFITTGLQEENVLLKSKLENLTKSVRMLNNGSNVLDEILQVGKSSENMKGIGFDYGTVNKEIKIPIKNFVPPKKKTEFVMLDHMPQHPVRHPNPQPRNKKKSPWICHHCGRKGHIRSFCFKLYGYPQPHVQPKVSGKIAQARKEWKPKTPNVSSSVTSSVSIGVPPVLTKSSNLVKSVPSVYKPHSMSKLHVEPLKNPNVEPNVKSSGMVSVVADNINEENVFVTPSKTVVVGPLKENLT
jgi:hypothetical protein